MKSAERVEELLRQFASDRDWEQFHTPRNLLIALVGEVGELAEQMQWRSDAEVLQLMKSSPEAVAEELADVGIYLIRLADVLGVDLDDAIRRKIALNAERYPASQVRGSANKASERTEDD